MFSNMMIAMRILHFYIKILTETLHWGPLFNWGPWAAVLKALALI
jgi:hypothetical protein